MTTLTRHSLSLASRARGLMALADLTGSERARLAAERTARSAYLAARREHERRVLRDDACVRGLAWLGVEVTS